MSFKVTDIMQDLIGLILVTLQEVNMYLLNKIAHSEE